MWLSKQQKRKKEEHDATSGRVTLSGDTVAVELAGERRGLAVYAPGGYRWRPTPGQQVLVLKSGEELCVAGTPTQGGLEEGEAGLVVGGTAVTLKKDGRLLLEGTVTVNGEELESLIRRVAAQVAGQ